LRTIPLRIAGSGFCPIVRGLPRAMFTPGASVGKEDHSIFLQLVEFLNRNSNIKLLFFKTKFCIISA